MKKINMLAIAALAIFSAPAFGQAIFDTGIPYENKVTGTVPLQCNDAGKNCRFISSSNPFSTAGKQESLALATANSAASLLTVYGGTYVFNQSCANYNGGVLALRYRGADGATMVTLLSKVASDTSGGTMITLGSNSRVDVLLPSGSTACNASVVRVP